MTGFALRRQAGVWLGVLVVLSTSDFVTEKRVVDSRL